MFEPATIALGEVLPHRNLRSLYRIYLLIIIWVGVLPWLLPLAFVSPPEPMLLLSGGLLLLVVFVIWWIGAYCHTIRYRFTPSEIVWEQGVWFHQTGNAPYDRITNIEIFQGPISRRFGISHLKIQMASADGFASLSILKIRGMTDAVMLKEYILARMKNPS